MNWHVVYRTEPIRHCLHFARRNFETFSYLPPLTPEQIAKQVRMGACLVYQATLVMCSRHAGCCLHMCGGVAGNMPVAHISWSVATLEQLQLVMGMT